MPSGEHQSPRIERIMLDGLGPFEGATLDIPAPEGKGELVLFEGPNGSGKTTILEAITVLVGGGTVRAHERLRRRARGQEANVSIRLHHGDVSLQVQESSTKHSGVPEVFTRFNQSARDNTPADWAVFAFHGAEPNTNLATEGPKRIERPALAGGLSFSSGSSDLGQVLVNLHFDRLQAWMAAEQAKGTDAEASLRAQADALQASLDRFAQALSDVMARKVTIEFLPRQRPPVIRIDGEVIPLDLLGEGLRKTFGWMSDLIARLELAPWVDTSRSPFDQDFWLLLDEVDQSLHPALQRRLLPTLRRLFPNARIYVATHSPFMVASAPDGWVFPLRPGSTHRVRGSVAPVKLGPGHSLAWAIEEVLGRWSAETRDILHCAPPFDRCAY